MTTAKNYRELQDGDVVREGDEERWTFPTATKPCAWGPLIVWHKESTVAERRATYKAGGVKATVKYRRPS